MLALDAAWSVFLEEVELLKKSVFVKVWLMLYLICKRVKVWFVLYETVGLLLCVMPYALADDLSAITCQSLPSRAWHAWCGTTHLLCIASHGACCTTYQAPM